MKQSTKLLITRIALPIVFIMLMYILPYSIFWWITAGLLYGVGIITCILYVIED